MGSRAPRMPHPPDPSWEENPDDRTDRIRGGAVIRRTGPRRSVGRRIERWAIGLLFAVLAFVLERAVMRSVRRQGRSDVAPAADVVTTQLTGSGADVDFE